MEDILDMCVLGLEGERTTMVGKGNTVLSQSQGYISLTLRV